MSERLNGKTAWEFACDWYTPDQIAMSIKNRFRTPSDIAIPDDIDSAGFAQWLTEQYRLAMAKGIQIAQSDCAERLAAAEALLNDAFSTAGVTLPANWFIRVGLYFSAKAGGSDA